MVGNTSSASPNSSKKRSAFAILPARSSPVLHGFAGIPEHVHDGGYAGQKQLRETEHAAEIGGIGVEDCALRLPDGLKPGLERQIFDETAEQAVAGVAV